jgi:hypothetical protein
LVEQLECVLNLAAARRSDLANAAAPDVWNFREEVATDSEGLLQEYPGFRHALQQRESRRHGHRKWRKRRACTIGWRS